MTVAPNANSITLGETVSVGANKTGGPTNPSHTENNTPTMNRNRGRSRNGENTRNALGGNASSYIPSVAKSYEGMMPKIKLVLALPGGKVTLAKLINAFRNDFSTYIAATMENGIDIFLILRDGLDPEVALEAKRFPVLKILAPIDSSASSQDQARHAAKE